jgi:hypothetical protein
VGVIIVSWKTLGRGAMILQRCSAIYRTVHSYFAWQGTHNRSIRRLPNRTRLE